MRRNVIGACLLVVAGLAAVQPVSAQQSIERENMVAPMLAMGDGGKKCSTWVADRRSRPIDAKADLAWVFGYLSSYNVTSEFETRRALTGELSDSFVAQWIDKFCKSHPNLQISAAPLALIGDVIAHRSEMMRRSMKGMGNPKQF